MNYDLDEFLGETADMLVEAVLPGNNNSRIRRTVMSALGHAYARGQMDGFEIGLDRGIRDASNW